MEVINMKKKKMKVHPALKGVAGAAMGATVGGVGLGVGMGVLGGMSNTGQAQAALGRVSRAMPTATKAIMAGSIVQATGKIAKIPTLKKKR